MLDVGEVERDRDQASLRSAHRHRPPLHIGPVDRAHETSQELVCRHLLVKQNIFDIYIELFVI
ncbi:hypothetical protein JMUB7472_26520 [Staphylococcus aureus]